MAVWIERIKNSLPKAATALMMGTLLSMAAQAADVPASATPAPARVEPLQLAAIPPAQPLPMAVVDADDGKPWIMVDTRQQTLTVYERDTVLKKFDYVALGRGGVGEVRTSGDGKTPLGTYHIAWINDNSRFHIFFGLDYPNLDVTEKAYKENLISKDVYELNKNLLAHKQLPLQDTPLGGQIGIHGIGQGDVNVHRRYNWTQGCVALTNEQVEQLANWVEVGTRVVIR